MSKSHYPSRLARWLALIALVSVGCSQSKEPEPEHLRQQKRQRRQAEQQLKQMAQQAEARGGETGEAPFHLWTEPVKQAYFELFRARGADVPRAAQALAQLGPDAAEALQRIASNQGLSAVQRSLGSMLLVEINMFRPKELTRLAREQQLPLVQQAAIQALARLGQPWSTKELEQIRAELSRERAAGSHRPVVELLSFIDRVQQRTEQWNYTSAQLVELDRLAQADTSQKLQLVLASIHPSKLERGLLTMLRSPAVRMGTKLGVAQKLVQQRGEQARELRELCAGGKPQVLRLEAARKLMQLGGKANRTYLNRLANSKDDPIAPLVQNLLVQESTPPQGKAP